MAGAPGGLTASIRRKLHEGRTPDEIVQELVAGGLGQVSAQRFVDRALAEDASGSPLPSAPTAPPAHDGAAPADALDQFIQTKSAETHAAEAKVGRKSLWVASILMCSGIVITAGSYIMADVGERYTLMWGPVVFGFLLWGKSVLGGLANARSFAWFTAAASIALPIVLTLVSLGIVGATAPTEDEIVRAEMAQFLSSKEGKMLVGDRIAGAQNAAAEKSMDDALESRRSSMDVDQLVVDFDEAPNEAVKCVVAMTMSRYTGEYQQWLAGKLNERVGPAPKKVKICAARAIAKLDQDAGIDLYEDWASGDDNELENVALIAMAGIRASNR
jgi:hypothetical protein